MHWTQATSWKNNKQRSKSRKEKRKDKKEKERSKDVVEPAQAESKEDLSIFTEALPWVTTTPQGRLAKVVEKSDTEMGLPPPPDLPAPPTYAATKVVMSEDEIKILNSLKDLQAAGEDLTEKQKTRMEALEEKRKTTGQTKELSHGHINRLDKAKNKVIAVSKRIEKLDQEWGRFMSGVTEKVKTHAQLYLACRRELVNTHQQRVAELQMARQETHQATSSLLEAEVSMLPEAPPVEGQMADLFANLEEVTREVGNSSIAISDEDMEEELVQDGDNKGQGKAGARKVNFQGAKSPNRVAQCHLKSKPEKGATAWPRPWEKGIIVMSFFHRTTSIRM